MSQERVSGLPEKGADLRGSLENLWEVPEKITYINLSFRN